VAILTASVGLAVLAGWKFDLQTLKSLYPGLISMKPNTALAFVLCGAALWALQIPGGTGTAQLRRPIPIATALSALLLGLLTLSEYVFHLRLDIDEFLFRETAVGEQLPGRMSSVTAIGFILIGTALLLLEVNRPVARRLSRLACSLCHVMALIVVFGYAYSGRFLYTPLSSKEMAIHTAALFVLLSVGVLCVRPDEGLVATLLKKSPGGTVIRRAVPISLAGAFLLGWLRLEGQRLGLFGLEIGVALLVVSASALFVFSTLRAARAVDTGAELLAAKQHLPDMLDLLVNGIPEYAIITLDPAGHIATCNLTAERLKGYRSEELIGKYFSILYVPEDVASGKPEHELKVAACEGRCEDEGWRRRKDGSRFWANVVITALRDERGELRGFGKVTRDLTESKRAEDQFQLAIEAAPTGMILVGQRGKIVLVNAQVEKLFGYDRAELLGQSIEELVPERFRGRHPEFRTNFAVHPQARPMGAGRDLYGLRKDGTEVPIEIALNPLESLEGKLVLSSVVDITERKRAEAERLLSQQELRDTLEQLRALSDRVHKAREDERTQVARDLHDQIGQVLTAVKMDVDWVTKRLPNGETQIRTKLGTTLDLVRDATQSLRSICTQLRPGVLDDLGLAAAIEWQATEFGSRTGIQCDVSVPTEDLDLDADRCTAVFRILQEALTNVARHAEAKVVRVSLAQRNGRVLLMVQDDGKGIRDSDMAVSKGSLGLLGIRERVQACGGELQIWGEAGTRTTLAVDIPWIDSGEKEGSSAHSVGR